MTPLAQEIANDLCRPVRDRQVFDPNGVQKKIFEAKCFEISAIASIVFDACKKYINLDELYETGRIFLPSPVTFLDMRLSVSGGRTGILLVERQDQRIEVFSIGRFSPPEIEQCFLGIAKTGILHSSQSDYAGRPKIDFAVGLDGAEECALLLGILGALYLINQPNIVGNRTHLPHAGLQRKIAASFGMSGKFPLRAWTEITLWVDPSGCNAERENKQVEAMLSGRKCLHFVRAFLRERRGVEEKVSAHWRGDPSLGIKRSRYRVRA